jgi:hypothetical protein
MQKFGGRATDDFLYNYIQGHNYKLGIWSTGLYVTAEAEWENCLPISASQCHT